MRNEREKITIFHVLRHDRITLVGQIGQGNFGKVFKGTYRPTDEGNEIDVAIKVGRFPLTASFFSF